MLISCQAQGNMETDGTGKRRQQKEPYSQRQEEMEPIAHVKGLGSDERKRI